MDKQQILTALQKAVKKAGTQAAFAEKCGIAQGRISDYLNGNRDIGNITLSTLFTLFPEISISFFKDEEKDNIIPQLLENKMLELFRNLPPEKQIQCFGLMCQTFGIKTKELK